MGGIIEQEAEEGLLRIPFTQPLQPLLGDPHIALGRAVARRADPQLGDRGKHRLVEGGLGQQGAGKDPKLVFLLLQGGDQRRRFLAGQG